MHAPALPPREKVRYLLSLLWLSFHAHQALFARPQSFELLAILAQIQLDADRRSYASLTSLSPAPHPSLVPLHDPFDSTAYGGPVKSVAEEWKEIRREVGAIVNVGASMLAVGTGLWWVGGGRSYAEVRRVFFRAVWACRTPLTDAREHAASLPRSRRRRRHRRNRGLPLLSLLHSPGTGEAACKGVGKAPSSKRRWTGGTAHFWQREAVGPSEGAKSEAGMRN